MTSFLKADRSRPVALWLFVVAMLVVLVLAVGGGTRLTDSGLSITEWRPVTGIVPPLSDAGWAEAFRQYQQIPQYEHVNRGMSLEAFKSIYWWEWLHRALARLVGLVFLVGFVVFQIRGQIPRRLVLPCAGLLILILIQGLVGWLMVRSGLSERVSVAPEMLTLHLALALFLFSGVIWCALEADAGQGRQADQGPWSGGALWLAVLIFVQSLLGALVAGNDAGRVYNDWPLMNGRLIPEDYLGEGLWGTLAHSAAAVQFHHRMVGYLVLILVLAFAFTAKQSRLIQPTVRGYAYILALAVIIQVALGILTLLTAAPFTLAALHQVLATLVLGWAVATAWRARRL